MHNQTNIKPSIPQLTINVPSRLKCTAVTGSECADNVFRAFPTPQLYRSLSHSRHGRQNDQSSHTSRHIPDDNRLIIRARDKEIGVRIIIYAKHITAMSLQCLQRHTAINIPYPDRSIIRRGREGVAIRGPRNVRQALPMSLQRPYNLTRVRRPQLYELVRRLCKINSASCRGQGEATSAPTTRCKKLAVWTKFDRGNAHCVSTHCVSQGIVWPAFVRL